MDPLSVTASIIAVLQLTNTVVTFLSELRDASKEQKRVAIEASNLYGLLTNLRYRVESAASSNDPWYNQVKSLAIVGGPLYQLKQSLEELVDSAGLLQQQRKRDVFAASLTWHWKAPRLEELLKVIDRLKSDINLALQHDLFSLAENIREGVVSNLAELARLEAVAAKEALHSKILNWLISTDPSSNYNAALRKRHPGTGSWLLEHATFLTWRSSKATSSTLWLYGDAGCGKTVLCSTLLQQFLESKEQTADSIFVWYFYFDFKDLKKQHCQDLLQSLFKQLAHDSNDLSAFEKLYSVTCNKGSSQPSEHMMKSILRDAVQKSAQTILVLDALDECTELDSLLTLLSEIQSWQKVTIAATSRSKQELTEFFQFPSCFKINVESSLIDKDIEAYIRHQTSNYATKKKWSIALQEDIVSTLTEGAGGMFQWVFCQLEALSKCLTTAAVKATLRSLPPTLDETYARIINGIKYAGYANEAVIALQWLCYSFRPVHPTELVDALAIHIGEEGGFDAERRFDDPNDLMTVCSNLISHLGSSKAEISEKHTEGDESCAFDALPVRLSHFSVQEYLLSPKCVLWSSFEDTTCHGIIGEGCLRYLLHFINVDPPLEHARQHFPLIDYAKRYWFQHLRKAGSLPTWTKQMAFELLTKPEKLLKWVQLCGDGLRDMVANDWEPIFWLEASDLYHPLVYSAITGLPDLVSMILLDQVCHNIGKDEVQVALLRAARAGSTAAIQLLLDTGADVNCAKETFGSPLNVAAKYGKTEVVRHLLDAGADVDWSERKNIWRHNYNALASAASRGQQEIVSLLLSRGASFRTRSKALGDAVYHPELLKMIINHGVDIDGRTSVGTPLQLAISFGASACVWILLEYGANVNAAPGPWGRPLEAAIRRGKEDVVLALFEAGAECNENSLNKAFETLLDSREGSTGRLAAILLELGANPNFCSQPYGSLLQRASIYNLYQTATTLIAAGAHPNAEGGRYGNALQAASVDVEPQLIVEAWPAQRRGDWRRRRHDRSLAKLKLIFSQATAKLSVECDANGSLFVLHDHEVLDLDAIYRLLTRSDTTEIDPRQLTMEDRTIEELAKQLSDSLHRTVSSGFYNQFKRNDAHCQWFEDLAREGLCPELALQVLLDFGGQIGITLVDSDDSSGETPTSYSPGLVQHLIESGADIDAIGGLYGTAIQAAARNGSNDVVEHFLQLGAQPNGNEGVFGNPLQAACATFNQNVKLVQTLLNAGAVVNAVGGLFGTALHAACHRGFQDVVRLLLDRGADVSIQAGRYCTALQAACASSNCRVDIVQMLLDAGADIDVEGGMFGNAKQAILAKVHPFSIHPPKEGYEYVQNRQNSEDEEDDEDDMDYDENGQSSNEDESDISQVG